MARKDLNKVLCERERKYGKVKTKPTSKKDDLKHGHMAWPFKGESTSPYPYKEGMKINYGSRKEFNENLNPLYGLLHKSVGKFWAKVHSELCKVFDKRSVINQHIFQHLYNVVEVNTFIHNGQVCYTNTHEGKVEPVKEGRFEYYVHPASGVLLENKGRITYRQQMEKFKEEREKEQVKHLRLISRFNNQNGNGARYAININDVWYEISVMKNPEPIKRKRLNSRDETEYYLHYPEINDISVHGARFMPPELHSNEFYVCRKEQLNTKRLKELKIR